MSCSECSEPRGAGLGVATRAVTPRVTSRIARAGSSVRARSVCTLTSRHYHRQPRTTKCSPLTETCVLYCLVLIFSKFLRHICRSHICRFLFIGFKYTLSVKSTHTLINYLL